MQFEPICLSCRYFESGDKCQYFNPISFEIKYTEIECPYYSGVDYELLGREASAALNKAKTK